MKKDVIKAMAALITAAFGLVAALAWNTAIQEIFRVLFGDQSGLLPLVFYATVVTVIAVIATLAIGRAAAAAGVKEEKPATEELEALRSEVRSLKEELQGVKNREADLKRPRY